MPQSIAEQIVRRRKQLLVYRFCYYVRSEPLVDDLRYDIMERELRHLVENNETLAATLLYVDDCPTKTVGSSNLWDYPRELQHVGDSLIAWVKEHPAGYTPPVEEEESQSLTFF